MGLIALITAAVGWSTGNQVAGILGDTLVVPCGSTGVGPTGARSPLDWWYGYEVWFWFGIFQQEPESDYQHRWWYEEAEVEEN